MASFTVDVPNEAVPDLVKAVAQRLGIAPPATGPEQAAMAERFCQQALFRVYVDFKAQEAAQLARDQAAAWD